MFHIMVELINYKIVFLLLMINENTVFECLLWAGPLSVEHLQRFLHALHALATVHLLRLPTTTLV